MEVLRLTCGRLPLASSSAPQPEILRKPRGSAASPLLPSTPNGAHPQKSMEFSFLRGGKGLQEGSTLG